MRKIREVLRLKHELDLSDRRIAQAIGSSRSTVQECLRRARAAGLAWPLPAAMDEEALHARLYHRQVPLARTPQPDFALVHAELGRRGVTRLLLWQEFKAALEAQLVRVSKKSEFAVAVRYVLTPRVALTRYSDWPPRNR